MIVKVLIGISIFAFIIYICLRIYYNYRDTRNNFLVSQGVLSKEIKVLNSDTGTEEFFKKDGGTLCMYVRLQNGDKTININDASPTLLRIENLMQINVINGGMRMELVINTKNTQTQRSQKEIIQLPSLPRQKWIHLCILRQGRRFDILYNGKIIASKRLNYVPLYIQSPIMVGHPKLRGEFIGGFVYNHRMSPRELKEEMESTSNTRGEPYIKDSAKDLLSIFSFIPSIGCPGGKPCNKNIVSPMDPTTDFESEYA